VGWCHRAAQKPWLVPTVALPFKKAQGGRAKNVFYFERAARKIVEVRTPRLPARPPVLGGARGRRCASALS
jgi:hypothetical protein